MKVYQSGLLQFLHNIDNVEIPLNQRDYCWKTIECKKLWDSILSVSDKPFNNYFLGNITIKNKQLIDGQQRLVSISLLINALENKMNRLTGNSSNNSSNKIQTSYLVNENNFENRYKLILQDKDKQTFTEILDKKTINSINYSKNIMENYKFFDEMINNTNLSINKIFNALLKFKIAVIELDDFDYIESFYSGANSSSRNMTLMDEVKNYLISKNEKHDIRNEIYNSYWLPIKNVIDNAKEDNFFNRFICNYLTIQKNEVVSLNDENIFFYFKEVFSEKLRYQTRIEVIKHLFSFFEYYKKIEFCNEIDEDIKLSLQAINNLNVKDANPFIMEVYDDYENNLVTKEVFIEILTTVENYIVECMANNSYSQSDENIFATLSLDLNKILTNEIFGSSAN